MKTISDGCISCLEIKKSKFYCIALNACSKMQVEAKLDEIKKLYPDANHYCYAVVTQNYVEFSDNFEPQGTAGKPILNVIQKNKIVNCLVVVVRYFGGIKLGTGPLTRAYSNSATLAIKNAQIKELKLFQSINFKINFQDAFNVYLLSQKGLFSVEKRIGNEFWVLREKEKFDEVMNKLKFFDVKNLNCCEVWL